MPGPDRQGPVDEFEAIARLLRPLAAAAPESLGLMDDAALVPARPGFDLVLSKDAMVEGVHFLPDDPLDLVARKLLRANLSDLAAKGAEPYAYLLAACWPERCGWDARALFAEGLAEDQAAYGLKLLGGDTASTPGPLTLSVTILGWSPAGAMVRRSGARPGDRILVSGTIGDGWLGLQAARGELGDLPAGDRDALADRYRLPQPRVALAPALLGWATAAADVSDGLVADAGHIGEASGCAIVLDLERLPLSAPAAGWLARQPDRAAALAALATGGDDYEVACACRPGDAPALVGAAAKAGVPLTEVGAAEEGEGTTARLDGEPLRLGRTGWRHG